MQRCFYGLILMMVLGACGEIAVEPGPVPTAPAATVDYDIAVFSVDFDPALQGNRLPISSQYAVLIAIENRGTITAYNITARATLTDKTSKNQLINGSKTVAELLPGEIKVVRIEAQQQIPAVAATYVLEVHADPLPEETIVSNNTRTFTISVIP